jgi:hypothetical protein
MKDTHYMFDNYWITIKAQDMFWDIVGDGRACMMLAMANSYEFALLGEPIY